MKLTKCTSILLPDIYLPPVFNNVSLQYKRAVGNPVVSHTLVATKTAINTAVRLRLSHSLVMVIIYGNINSVQKLKKAARGIATACLQHAFHNGLVAFIYTALVLTLASVRKQNNGRIVGIPSNSKVESLLAGLVAGGAAFSLDQSAVALQIFAFVLGRGVQSVLPGIAAPINKTDSAILTASASTPVPIKPAKKMLYRPPSSHAITVSGALVYAAVLTMHSHGHDRLNSGLSRSLMPIYGKFGRSVAA
ncbi:uncharacterized protein UMAG_01437 [Mycosarcoma maydis]|uniref:Uncharacterized protein n=1 Tax=Mycosarcoma maydis TaxID=5270 RepID=A0A0D1E6L3_MYCMD|nr:uncharacterized protein UMAG_01437 [Ustilago maydis 521]KIS71544.1 hypothetical protein UMAG_01437 [Ustilago maydis 521]|eukprot:XP_011387306.1 hypothetical protein UMAG_01437 [Ustilago maydis 521]